MVTSAYDQRLRRLAINAPHHVEGEIGVSRPTGEIDARVLALARLAALIAIGGSGRSFTEHADAALSAGATTDGIVDLLVGVGSVVGAPRVVWAASRLALALRVDEEEIFD